ncbi:MAG: hypothetical protein K0Q80_1836 [Microvirga sp.]|nr:hypothetical protein [Microvirga sp.]
MKLLAGNEPQKRIILGEPPPLGWCHNRMDAPGISTDAVAMEAAASPFTFHYAAKRSIVRRIDRKSKGLGMNAARVGSSDGCTFTMPDTTTSNVGG